MNIFNMTKKTSSKIKEVSLALILICSLIGVTRSTSAKAAPRNIENAISGFIFSQGEIMLSELKIQLQQSIDNEVKNFSDNFSIDNTATWLATEEKVKLAKTSLNEKASNTVNKTITK